MEVVNDNNSSVTRVTLSQAQILEILGSGKCTSYKPTIIEFYHSGEQYIDVMEIFPFSTMKIDSVFNSFRNNLKTLRAENPSMNIELRRASDGILLINVTAVMNKNENENDENDTDDADVSIAA